MLPKELQNILNEAKKAVLEHPKGELILPIRKSIWRAFGSCKKFENKTLPTIGLKRRLELAKLCVEKVIDIWKEAISNNKRILKMIEISQKYINGSIDSESVIEHYNCFIKLLNDISDSVRYYDAVSVGFAATYMIDIALGDEALIINSDDKLDEDLNPDSWDSSFNACSAYAGGGPWDEDSNIKKRQEFWLWYITEAVPQAYLNYVDDSYSNIGRIVSLTTEDGKEILNPTKQQVINELYSLDQFDNSFMILENDTEWGIESFIQTGKGAQNFIVEVRINSSDGSGTQWNAEYYENDNDKTKNISMAKNEVETLNIETVEYLFQSFMEGDLLPKGVKWIDISDSFRTDEINKQEKDVVSTRKIKGMWCFIKKLKSLLKKICSN